MASEPPLEPEVKDALKRELGAIGPNVLDLERTLRDAGFRGVDVWNDMIRGFAETPDELVAFDRSREVHAAKKFANQADFSEDHLSPAERRFEATRFGSPDFQRMQDRFGQTFEEDAARFAAPLQGQGSFWSMEDRVMAVKWGGAKCGMIVSTAPKLAEVRAVVGLQVRHKLSIVGALSGVQMGMVPSGMSAIVDWRVGLIANEINIAIKRRLAGPHDHVPVDLVRGVMGLHMYRSCKSLPEIAASAGAFSIAIRWCAEQLERVPA